MGIKNFFQGNKEKRQERRANYKKGTIYRELPDGGRESTVEKVNRFKNQKTTRVDYDNGDYTFTGTKKTNRKSISQDDTDFVTDSGLNTVKYTSLNKRGKNRSTSYEKNLVSQRTPYAGGDINASLYYDQKASKAADRPQYYTDKTLSGDVKKVTKNRRKTKTETGKWSPDQNMWLNSKKVVRNPKNNGK